MESSQNDANNLMQLGSIRPNIGLDINVRQQVVEILKKSLVDEIILTLNTHFVYWNLSGAGIYDLRLLLDLQYKKLNEITDNIEERVRMLGGLTFNNFNEFQIQSSFADQLESVSDINRLLSGHETLICGLRVSAKKVSEEYEDEGTFEFLVSLIRLHEKMDWMLGSFTKRNE